MGIRERATCPAGHVGHQGSVTGRRGVALGCRDPPEWPGAGKLGAGGAGPPASVSGERMRLAGAVGAEKGKQMKRQSKGRTWRCRRRGRGAEESLDPPHPRLRLCL